MNAQHTEIIDFTAALLSKKLQAYLVEEEYDTAQTLAALMEGYLEGLWTVTWKEGEPYFNLTEADEISLAEYTAVARDLADLDDDPEGASADSVEGPELDN